MKLFICSFFTFLIIGLTNVGYAQIDYQDYKQVKFTKNNPTYINQITTENIAGITTLKYESKAIETPIMRVEPFLGISVGYIKKQLNSVHADATLSTSADGVTWSAFVKLPDAHNEAELGKNINTDLFFIDKNVKFVKFLMAEKLTTTGSQIDSLQVNFISPGVKTTALTTPNTGELLRTDACPCPQPAFRSRADWNCPPITVTYTYTTVTHLIVHHSAGANTSSDWDAVVRGIFIFHTTMSGYSDIGYNWLIAPNGVLYEGRGGGNNVQGAHFCGTNARTMGVCMIGTYTTANITPAARATLVDILAWKCCNSSINPTQTSLHTGSGLTINNISGHRDGCATECPGNTTYTDLPGVRIDVNDKINNACTLTAINNLDNIKAIKITPNPASTNATLQFNLLKIATTNIQLINIDGKVVYQKNIGKLVGLQNINIPLQGKAAGIYTLKIINNKEVASLKLIKK